MKRKHKIFLKANIMSLFFIAVSFISGTLAWFAYTGLSDVATEIDIRAWNIELNDGKTSNDIKIALPEISPGMDTISEVVNINNLGDTDAIVNYSIVSARILDSSEDNYVASEIDENAIKIFIKKGEYSLSNATSVKIKAVKKK